MKGINNWVFYLKKHSGQFSIVLEKNKKTNKRTLCGDGDETIYSIISERSKLTQKDKIE